MKSFFEDPPQRILTVNSIPYCSHAIVKNWNCVSHFVTSPCKFFVWSVTLCPSYGNRFIFMLLRDSSCRTTLHSWLFSSFLTPISNRSFFKDNSASASNVKWWYLPAARAFSCTNKILTLCYTKKVFFLTSCFVTEVNAFWVCLRAGFCWCRFECAW